MPSRLKYVQTAVRPVLSSRLLIAGPAGAGKTESALVIAGLIKEHLNLAGRVLVLDTEHASALTYAERYPDDPKGGFAFDHLPWAAPYDPRELAVTLDEVDERTHPVVIIDSFSHFWNKEGGTLAIANGKITGWKDARPIQNEAIEAILRSRSHVIICARQKMAYAIEETGGKQKVTKLGLASIQDDDLEYEVQVTLVMDVDHQGMVTKSRAGDDLPVGRLFPPTRGRVEFAEQFVGFLKGGVEMLHPREVDWLKAWLNEDVARRKAWRAASFPPPTSFPELRRDELVAWLSTQGVDVSAQGGMAPAEPPAAPQGDESAPKAENSPERPEDPSERELEGRLVETGPEQPPAAEGDAAIADEVAAASKARGKAKAGAA